MNKLGFDNKANITLSKKLPGATGTRPVVMLSGSGIKKGRLLAERGRILLGRGEEFVDSYMLIVDADLGMVAHLITIRGA